MAVSPPMRILVVDDDEAIREVVASELRAAGHDVEVAASGREALALAAARPPDLLLLDSQMPEMDGDAVIEAVRGASRISTTPVIMVTAHGGVPSDTTIGYLRKPFTFAALERLIDAFARDPERGFLLSSSLRSTCPRCEAKEGRWCTPVPGAADGRMHVERLTRPRRD